MAVDVESVRTPVVVGIVLRFITYDLANRGESLARIVIGDGLLLDKLGMYVTN